MHVDACRVTNHGEETVLLLVVVDNGSRKPRVLRIPDFPLKATQSPSDQHKSTRTLPSALSTPITKREAGVNRIRKMKRSTDPRPINRHSEAGGRVDESEGEGFAPEVDDGGGGAEEKYREEGED